MFLFFLPFTLEVSAKPFIDLAAYESFIIIKALIVFWILKQASVLSWLPPASRGPCLIINTPSVLLSSSVRLASAQGNVLFEAQLEEVYGISCKMYELHNQSKDLPNIIFGSERKRRDIVTYIQFTTLRKMIWLSSKATHDESLLKYFKVCCLLLDNLGL